MRDVKQHESRYIHVPKTWLRTLIFLPAAWLAWSAYSFFFTGGGPLLSFIGFVLAADVMAFAFAWYRRRLAVVAVMAVMAVMAVVMAVVDIEEETNWWYF